MARGGSAWRLEAQQVIMEAHHGAQEAHLGTVEAHHGALETHHGGIFIYRFLVSDTLLQKIR